MIFNHLELNGLSPKKLSFFFGCALPKNFDLSTDGNDLKVAFCHIDYCPIEHSSA